MAIYGKRRRGRVGGVKNGSVLQWNWTWTEWTPNKVHLNHCAWMKRGAVRERVNSDGLRCLTKWLSSLSAAAPGNHFLGRGEEWSGHLKWQELEDLPRNLCIGLNVLSWQWSVDIVSALLNISSIMLITGGDRELIKNFYPNVIYSNLPPFICANWGIHSIIMWNGLW